MNTKIGIAKLRIKKLFLHYHQFMKEHNREHLIGKKMRESCAHICSLLQPAALRARMQTALDCEAGGIHEDWNKFYTYCLREALSIDKYVPVIPPRATPDTASNSHSRYLPDTEEHKQELPSGSRKKNRRFKARRNTAETTGEEEKGKKAPR